MKKYCSYKGTVGKVVPNILNSNFQPEKPNEKWITNITEFKLLGEKLYLSPTLDLLVLVQKNIKLGHTNTTNLKRCG